MLLAVVAHTTVPLAMVCMMLLTHIVVCNSLHMTTTMISVRVTVLRLVEVAGGTGTALIHT